MNSFSFLLSMRDQPCGEEDEIAVRHVVFLPSHRDWQPWHQPGHRLQQLSPRFGDHKVMLHVIRVLKDEGVGSSGFYREPCHIIDHLRWNRFDVNARICDGRKCVFIGLFPGCMLSLVFGEGDPLWFSTDWIGKVEIQPSLRGLASIRGLERDLVHPRDESQIDLAIFGMLASCRNEFWNPVDGKVDIGIAPISEDDMLGFITLDPQGPGRLRTHLPTGKRGILRNCKQWILRADRMETRSAQQGQAILPIGDSLSPLNVLDQVPTRQNPCAEDDWLQKLRKFWFAHLRC